MAEFSVKEVIRVIDADTLDLMLDLGFNIFVEKRVRLSGIDSPEIHSKLLEEKEHAIRSKKYVINFFEGAKLNNQKIILKILSENEEEDKYGRILGEIIVDNKSLNNLLLENNLAFPYYGNKKIPYSQRVK